MARFRFHRGSLADSKTTTEIPSGNGYRFKRIGVSCNE